MTNTQTTDSWAKEAERIRRDHDRAIFALTDAERIYLADSRVREERQHPEKKLSVTKSIRLPLIGTAPAKAAADLLPGDVILWAYGGSSTVLAVFPGGNKLTITAVLKETDDGTVIRRELLAERLVAVG